MQIDSQLQNLTRIFNLESLILISNIGLFKCFIPQLKSSLLGMTITRYQRGTKRIHLCFICIRWRSMSDPKIQKKKVQTFLILKTWFKDEYVIPQLKLFLQGMHIDHGRDIEDDDIIRCKKWRLRFEADIHSIKVPSL